MPLAPLSPLLLDNLRTRAERAFLFGMTTKSREYLYGTQSAERAKEARKLADKLACEAWNYRMLEYKGPAQPLPTIGDAINGGYATSPRRKRHRLRFLQGVCLLLKLPSLDGVRSSFSIDTAVPFKTFQKTCSRSWKGS